MKKPIVAQDREFASLSSLASSLLPVAPAQTCGSVEGYLDMSREYLYPLEMASQVRKHGV